MRSSSLRYDITLISEGRQEKGVCVHNPVSLGLCFNRCVGMFEEEGKVEA